MTNKEYLNAVIDALLAEGFIKNGPPTEKGEETLLLTEAGCDLVVKIATEEFYSVINGEIDGKRYRVIDKNNAEAFFVKQIVKTVGGPIQYLVNSFSKDGHRQTGEFNGCS